MNRYTLKSKLAALIVVFGVLLRVSDASASGLLLALGFSLESFSDTGTVAVGVGNASRVTTPLCFVFGGIGGASGISLGNNGAFCGDAISGGPIVVNNYTKVFKKCITLGDPVTLKTGATCADTDTTGNNPLLVAFFASFLSGGFFACNVQTGNATQTEPAINLAASKKLTITDGNPGGLNLIDVPSMTLGNSSTLTLSGGSSDTVVLRVDGASSIGHSAKILLTGGLTPFSVVIATQGGISFWGNSTTVNGTILNGLPFSTTGQNCTIGTGATISGAVLCENNLSIGANLRLDYEPAIAVDIPNTCIGG
jgi:hypothetical protein